MTENHKEFHAADGPLRGKTAVITGGSRGIGAAIAEKLASLGADAAILYAGNAAAAEETAARCRGACRTRVKAYRCVVSDAVLVKKTAAEIKAGFGGVQILVNNAGITRDGLAAVMREEAFESVIETNLTGAFYMIRYCMGMLMRSGDGCIINISSVSGLTGNAGQCNYAASKAGLIGLTKSVAKEMASRGIRCNAIAPGFIRTDMTVEQKDNPWLRQIPLGRMGEAAEVAEAAAFLVSAKYITGEVLRVDGGIAM